MKAINLNELFNTRIFRIPDYQRGYAWEEKQLSELWDDLDEIGVNNGELRKHYTGTIYLEETQPNDIEKWLTDVKFYNVVDGQQRLTTISILLYELLKATEIGYAEKNKKKLLETFISESNMSGESKVYKFSYSLIDKNYNFLLHSIFEDSKVVLNHDYQNLYTKNLTEAKKYFSVKISQLNDKEKDILFKKITTALQFDIRIIEKDLDVQAVFETMNNRGKLLSTLEKLKNRLIYLTVKLSSPDESKKVLRKKINEAWGKIYTCLAQNPDTILDEDIFLSAHLSLYRKPKEAVFSEKVAEEKVFQMFCNKSEKFDKDESGEKEPLVSYNKIEDYIIKLSEAAPIWYKIHNSQSLILKKILLLNSGKEIKVFLLALLLKSEEENLKQVFINLEKILFRNGTLGFFDERRTAKWGWEIYSDEVNLDGINQMITGLIQKPISTPDLISQMNNLFTYVNGNKGFHRWGILKYFLFEYEEILKKRSKETDDKINIDNYEDTSIEHIIPQDFKENWSEVVYNFANGIEDEKKYLAYKILINTLGNLTILKGPKNSSLGKKGWDEKKNRFSTGSYNEIVISKYTNWTKKEIMERGIDMLSFLENKIDGLKFTEEEKNKVLFYEDYVIKKFTEL